MLCTRENIAVLRHQPKQPFLYTGEKQNISNILLRLPFLNQKHHSLNLIGDIRTIKNQSIKCKGELANDSISRAG